MNLYALLIVLTASALTILLRALPFLLFGGGRPMPPLVRYLGGALPAAIIAILVIYCIRSVVPFSLSGSVPQLLALGAVAALHLWKRSTLLSIFGGTALYMVLIRLPLFA